MSYDDLEFGCQGWDDNDYEEILELLKENIERTPSESME